MNRALILLASLLFAPPSVPRAVAAEDSTEKPNITLIMADDLGCAGLGCYGQKLIHTPEIDRMPAAGMRFGIPAEF